MAPRPERARPYRHAACHVRARPTRRASAADQGLAPADRTDYGPGLWAHILRDQLQVSEKDLWACVRDGAPPDRGARQKPADALPADLVHLLTHRVGLTDPEVAALTKDEAVTRVQAYWMGDR
jgi:hypothetical protein